MKVKLLYHESEVCYHMTCHDFLERKPHCYLIKFKMCKLRKLVHVPLSKSVCLRALASNTLTLGTGSEARLRRLGSKCSTNWSTGMHSSLTTACDEKTKNWHFNGDQHGSPQNTHFCNPKEAVSESVGLRGHLCLNFKLSTTDVVRNTVTIL